MVARCDRGDDLHLVPERRLGTGQTVHLSFDAAHPGVNVTFSFGPSDQLASQIKSEGTADVFASASETYLDQVASSPGVAACR